MFWVLAAVVAVLLIGCGFWLTHRHGAPRRRSVVHQSQIERARADGQERLYNDYLPGRTKHD